MSTTLVCQFPVTTTLLEPIYNNSIFQGQASKQAGTIASGINASIATQLTQLPIPSATVGTTSIKQRGSDEIVPFENLGPIFTDRPDTVGRGHIFVGFNYQHFNFNAIDGINLSALPFGFQQSVQSTTNPNDTQTLFASNLNNVSFKLDQYVGVVTYGLSKKADISVVVPVNQVNLSVLATNGLAYIFDSVSKQYSTVGTPGATVTTSGSSSGIGDVVINFKQLILGGDGSRFAMAAGVSYRIPSGNALNYLGSGTFGGNAYGLFEYRARVAPHLKLSYQWNGNSQLMDINSSPHIRLPGGLQYAAGADVRLIRTVTLAADVLGSQVVNTSSITSSPLSLPNAPSSAAIPLLPATTVGATTYTTVNFSGGLKWLLPHHVLVYGNVLDQVNNVGLRSNLVPVAGIAYNIGTRSKNK